MSKILQAIAAGALLVIASGCDRRDSGMNNQTTPGQGVTERDSNHDVNRNSAEYQGGITQPADPRTAPEQPGQAGRPEVDRGTNQGSFEEDLSGSADRGEYEENLDETVDEYRRDGQDAGGR